MLLLDNSGIEGLAQQGFPYALGVACAPDNMGFGAVSRLLNGIRLSPKCVHGHFPEESFLFQWEALGIAQSPTSMFFLTCSQLRLFIWFWLEIRAAPYPAFQPAWAIPFSKKKKKYMYAYVHT